MNRKPVLAKGIKYKTPGEVLDLITDFADKLSADSLTGKTPTITISGEDTALTVSSEAVNATITNIEDRNGITVYSVPANKGVEYRVTGGTSGVQYEMLVSCPTVDGQTMQMICLMRVEA